MEDLRLYINTLRHDFAKQTLSKKEVNTDPILQFEKWFKEAVDAHVNEPNAMTLATATADGKPSARIVLLRNFSSSGFVFYTNYTSRKGTEVMDNPTCALLFFWPELERQRIDTAVHQGRQPDEHASAGHGCAESEQHPV